MPLIQFGDRFYTLRAGDNLLGAGPPADIRLPDLAGGRQIGISVESVGVFAWSTGGGLPAHINGRPLGDEPVPLFHGDMLEVSGSKLTYHEEGQEATLAMAPRRGSKPGAATTQRLPGANPDGELDPTLFLRQTPPPTPAPPKVAVLRRHEDGQHHAVDRGGLRIGREKRCDLIIADPSVSRLHAEITFSRGRYLLRDLGRSGTFLNGERLEEPRSLEVGDVIRVGNQEFTFLLRPVRSPDAESAPDVTPVRSRIPDAPTLLPGTGRGSGRILSLLLLAALAAAIALVLLA